MTGDRPLRILQVSNTDLVGRAFNGYDLIDDLDRFSTSCEQIVLHKSSCDTRVHQILSTNDIVFQKRIGYLESVYGVHDAFFPWAERLKQHPSFINADIVHYHLIQNQMLSLFDFADLTRIKPSVWTLHDPWFFTGHCIHPIQCELWRTGCEHCPDLERPFSIGLDTSAINWAIKKQTASLLESEIVVHSAWMFDMLQQSPIGRQLQNTRLIDFGIKGPATVHTREEARIRLKIPAEAQVLFFRNDDIELKGTADLMKVLESFEHSGSLVLLTVGESRLPRRIRGRYQAIELGWSNDRDHLFDAFSACDLFLMPSWAESFGAMAAEAMIVGRPVIAYENTALSSTINAPACGTVVPWRDTRALSSAIRWHLNNPDQSQTIGKKAQAWAQEKYDYLNFLNKIMKTYHAVTARRIVRSSE